MDDSEEELVGVGMDGIGYYLPYENAKYYLVYKIETNNEVTITSCSPNADSTAEVCGDSAFSVVVVSPMSIMKVAIGGCHKGDE